MKAQKPSKAEVDAVLARLEAMEAPEERPQLTWRERMEAAVLFSVFYAALWLAMRLEANAR